MANQMKHNIKDSIFTTVFRIPEYTLDMYRSLHPEDTGVTEEDINIITIENILVTGMFNDLGFQVRNNFIILVEAQSTFSVKLSIRLFLYLAETLKKYIEKMAIDLYSDSNVMGYRKKTVLPDGSVRREDPLYKLPTPELYVIYTGEKEVPDELDISDLYEAKPDGTKPLSLKVKIIKSDEKNDSISQYIKFCRAANQMRNRYPNDLKKAVQELVEYCTENDILSAFVKEHRDEVYEMMDVLFNQEYVTQVHEDNLVWQGYNQAKEEDRAELLSANTRVDEMTKELDKANILADEMTKERDKANILADEMIKERDKANTCVAEMKDEIENLSARIAEYEARYGKFDK